MALFFSRYNDTFTFAAGDIGIEYNFDIPLLISIRLRPEFGGNGYYKETITDLISLWVKRRTKLT
jgi:hypothetical protein